MFAAADFDGLIFDCDGTLIDSMPAHYHAWLAALAPVGIELPEARFYGLAGMPTSRIAELLVRESQVDADPQQLSARKEENFLQSLSLTRPIDKVIEIVLEFHGRRPMAVASGGFRRVILRQLDHLGITDRFDAIVTAEDTQRHKPNPDVFLEAARRLQVPADRCCVYEDAELGFEAARRAGMACVDVRDLYS